MKNTKNLFVIDCSDNCSCSSRFAHNETIYETEIEAKEVLKQLNNQKDLYIQTLEDYFSELYYSFY